MCKKLLMSLIDKFISEYNFLQRQLVMNNLKKKMFCFGTHAILLVCNLLHIISLITNETVKFVKI